LPWLAQFVGVHFPLGTPETVERARIKEEGPWKRGWLSTLISKVKQTLTGFKRVRVTERSSTAWTLLITTYPSETPNAAETQRVAEEWTPLGIILTVTQSSAPLIDEGTREIDLGTGTIDASTLAEVT
jgi:hypothetical protein